MQQTRQQRYGIPDRNVYSFNTITEIANNDDIDVVYIVTPPGVHARDAIKAAEAGKHVWCEKPMAMDEEECRAVIEAAEKSDVQLTIGYRMQHEPNTQAIIRYGVEKTYGSVTAVRTGAGYSGAHPYPNDWRRIGHLGVTGRPWSEREDMYGDVDEFTIFEFEFPDGVLAMRTPWRPGATANSSFDTCSP